MTNPLLDFTDLPLFNQIRPEHVGPAIDSLLAQANQALETVTHPDFPGVREVAGWITPVPGGVGPMTVTMLLVNTLQAAEQELP